MNDLYIYHLYRDQMKTGDMLQWSSNSLIGAAIRWKTCRNLPEGWPKVNHTSLILRLKEYEGLARRAWTPEALEHGFYPNLLSRRLERFDGEVYWYPLKDEYNDMRQIYGERMTEMFGIGYDFLSLFKQLVMNVSVDVRELFCSESALVVWGYSGKALPPALMPALDIFKPHVRIL